MLDNYTHEELVHIVDMYNLDIDIDKMKKTKANLKKEMMKVGKKKLSDAKLPSKKEIKPMVEKDKKNPKSLITRYFKKVDPKKKEAKKEEPKTKGKKKLVVVDREKLIDKIIDLNKEEQKKGKISSRGKGKSLFDRKTYKDMSIKELKELAKP